MKSSIRIAGLGIIPLLAIAQYGGFTYPPGSGTGGLQQATFASPPSSPSTNSAYLFTDASAAGTCTGGGSAYSVCVWNGSTFQATGGTSTGLGDPGSNGLVFRNGAGTSTVASATQLSGPYFCQDAGSTDTYACNLSPAIASYVAGTLYWFKANTANTGAATINFNAKGALAIKKIIGAITTDLSDNDIRSGQWVGCFYDGTNCQMATQLGTAVDLSSIQTLLNKTVDGVTPTVFGFLDATSSIQTQLNSKVATSAIIPNTNGGTGGDSSAATGIPHVAAGTWSYSNVVNTDISASAAIAISKLAAQAADSVVMNATGGSAVPTAVLMPTGGTNGCAGTSDALTYNNVTHALGCNTIAGGGGGSPGGVNNSIQTRATSSTFGGFSGFLFESNAQAVADPNFHRVVDLSVSPTLAGMNFGFPNLAGINLALTANTGFNDDGGQSKLTINALELDLTSPAAGQRQGLQMYTKGYGSGDMAWLSGTLEQAGGCNDSGCEGTQPIRLITQETQGLQTANITSVTPQTCSGTITQAVSKSIGQAPQSVTFTITSAPGTCPTGQVIDVGESFVDDTSAHHEVTVITTGFNGTTISAVFESDHPINAAVLPATVLAVDNTAAFGEQRELVITNAGTSGVFDSYSTGSFASASGTTITGSGTAWSSPAGPVHGTALIPGVIAFDLDAYVGSPYSAAAPLNVYYPISSVASATSLNIITRDAAGTRGYAGKATAGSGYKILSGALIRKISGSTLYLEANNFRWTAGQVVECAHSASQVFTSNLFWSNQSAGQTLYNNFGLINNGVRTYQSGISISQQAIPTPTLTTGINNVTTTIPISSDFAAYSQNGATITIDSEYLLVTAGGGTTTLTATRGVQGSTAASHSSGASVHLSNADITAYTNALNVGALSNTGLRIDKTLTAGVYFNTADPVIYNQNISWGGTGQVGIHGNTLSPGSLVVGDSGVGSNLMWRTDTDTNFGEIVAKNSEFHVDNSTGAGSPRLGIGNLTAGRNWWLEASLASGFQTLQFHYLDPTNTIDVLPFSIIGAGGTSGPATPPTATATSGSNHASSCYEADASVFTTLAVTKFGRMCVVPDSNSTSAPVSFQWILYDSVNNNPNFPDIDMKLSSVGKLSIGTNNAAAGPTNQFAILDPTGVTTDRNFVFPDIAGTIGVITGSAPASNDCPKFVVTGSVISLTTSGGPCGAGSVTTSGSPAIHQLTVFSSASAITGIGVGTTDKPLVGVTGADPTFSKLTLTNPATSATLTVADGGSLITSGAFAGTFIFGATASFTMPGTSQTIPGLGQANAWTTGLQDFSAANVKLPSATGFVATSSNMLGYDSTNTNVHVWDGADGIVAPVATAPTTGHCVQFTVVSGKVTIADAGGACTTGGGGGTVASGTATHFAYYGATGTTVSDMGADFTFDGTHTLAGGASAIFDLSAAATFKVPGSYTTGVLHNTTTTGAVVGGLIVNADITNATIDLTAKVTGILPGANGGSGNGFFAVSGPATSLKTFTFPNASATVLTSNAAVTAAQGGTGGDSSGSTGIAHVAAGVWSYSTIVNADISASAAIALSKLATQAADTLLANATGSAAVPTAVAFPTGGTNGCAGATNALIYNTTTHVLGCNTISTSSVALSSVTAAVGSNTIANGNNPQVWNWAQTTAGQTGMAFGETTAATSTGTPYLVSFTTLIGSTATPVNLVNSLNGSQTLPTISVTPTWNTTGVVDAAVLVNVTNTASGAASKLLDLQVGGTSEFSVDKSGIAKAAGGFSSGSSAPTCANGTGGAVCISEGTAATGEASVAILYTSTSHILRGILNNGTDLPIPQGPASTTSGDLTSWSGTAGALLVDAGVVAANVITDSGNLTNHGVVLGTGNKTVSSLALAAAGTLLGGVASSDPAFTATPTLGVAGTTAGTLALAGVTAGTFTIGATPNTTASNTLLGPAAVVANGNVLDCTTSSTTCTLHDSGVATANVVTAASNYTSGAFVVAAGANKTTSGSTVPATGVLTFLGTPSSANLAAAVTDETGSGALVFGTSPVFGTGVTFSSAPITISGNISSTAWTTSGLRIKGTPGTLTDTSSSGTVATAYTDVLGGNTIAASSSTTFTNYFSMYVNNPVAGSNVTLTSKWAVGGDSMSIGTSTPFQVSTSGAVIQGTWSGTAIPNTKGGTGGDSSAQTGFAKVSSGTWSYAVIGVTDLPAVSFGTGTSKTFSAGTPSAMFECTGACTITMPVPAAGQQYCVRNANNIATVITFAAIGSSAMYENTASTAYGTAGTGTLVSGGAVGDKMCLVGKDATHFDVFSFSGTWTAN